MQNYVLTLAQTLAKQEQFAELLTSAYIDTCLLYTSDAADERSSVDLGGRRIIKKKNNIVKEADRALIKQNNYNIDITDTATDIP